MNGRSNSATAASCWSRRPSRRRSANRRRWRWQRAPRPRSPAPRTRARPPTPRLRAADREHAEALEAERRFAWLIEQRRAAPDQGETAVRRAQLEGERAAERRAVERIEQQRRARDQRLAALEAQSRSDAELAPGAARFAAVLEGLVEALETLLGAFEEELRADSAAGDALAGALRECAGEESGLQARMRELADPVTAAEVEAQQARDQAAESEGELGVLADRLGLEAMPAAEELPANELAALRDRVERLARRREALGPVNPLAAEEYREALERVEELEAARSDLENALRELRTLIRNTDREIAESFQQTFIAAADNFEAWSPMSFPAAADGCGWCVSRPVRAPCSAASRCPRPPRRRRRRSSPSSRRRRPTGSGRTTCSASRSR